MTLNGKEGSEDCGLLHAFFYGALHCTLEGQAG